MEWVAEYKLILYTFSLFDSMHLLWGLLNAAVVSGLLIRLLPLPRVSALGTFLTSLGIVLAASIFNRLAIKYCIGVITGKINYYL